MPQPRSVDIYTLENSQDAKVGTITFDGKGFFLDPPASPLLKSCLEDQFMIGGKVVDRSSPEAFLDAMPRQYRSGYLRAVPVGNSSN